MVDVLPLVLLLSLSLLLHVAVNGQKFDGRCHSMHKTLQYAWHVFLAVHVQEW